MARLNTMITVKNSRKAHTCILCYGDIPVGSSYTKYNGLYEGEWQNWKAHHECFAYFQHENPGADELTEGDTNREEALEWYKNRNSDKT